MNLLKKHKVSCLNENLIYSSGGYYRLVCELEEWEQPIILTVLQYALTLAVPILITVGILFF